MIREACVDDIDNNLLNLYIAGFNMHYNNRKDVFPDLDYDKLKCNFLKMFDEENKKIFVVEEDSIIVGFIVLEIRERKNKTIWVDELYVDDNYRKKGYGKKLMDYAYAFAKENACARVELNCWTFNEGANKFYNNLGYIEQRIVYEKEVN